MSKISSAIKNKNAFIPFVTCGDPDFATTQKIIESAVDNGADMVILGIPFSDPTAEGPVIQESNMRALEAGVTTDKIFSFIKDLRKQVSVPFAFKTYANVIFSYDADKFISICSDVGVDALIIPDLPYEEKDEFLPMCKKYGVDLISVVVPAQDERIAQISKDADGFIYIIASNNKLPKMTAVIRENTDLPCVAAFESVTAYEAETALKSVDGIAVDSDIVRLIEKYKTESAKYVGEFVKQFKN